MRTLTRTRMVRARMVRAREDAGRPLGPPEQRAPKTLLGHIDNNIRTIRRTRDHIERLQSASFSSLLGPDAAASLPNPATITALAIQCDALEATLRMHVRGGERSRMGARCSKFLAFGITALFTSTNDLPS